MELVITLQQDNLSFCALLNSDHPEGWLIVEEEEETLIGNSRLQKAHFDDYSAVCSKTTT